MIVRGAILALTISLTPAPNWSHPLPPDVMDALAKCETNKNIKHETMSYVGAFGFAKSTWKLFTPVPPHRAKYMTYGEQMTVLDHAFWYGKRQPNGRFQWPVGPWGHGCFKQQWKTSPKLRTAVCNNGKQSVRRWCRKP